MERRDYSEVKELFKSTPLVEALKNIVMVRWNQTPVWDYYMEISMDDAAQIRSNFARPVSEYHFSKLFIVDEGIFLQFSTDDGVIDCVSISHKEDDAGLMFRWCLMEFVEDGVHVHCGMRETVEKKLELMRLMREADEDPTNDKLKAALKAAMDLKDMD